GHESRAVAECRRREVSVRSHVEAGETLEQRHRTAFGDTSLAVDHQVLLEPDRVLAWAEERDSDSRVAADVLDLMVEMQVCADDFITFDGYPDDRHLWTPIAVQRRQMGQRTGGNEGSDRLRNCHGSSSSRSEVDQNWYTALGLNTLREFSHETSYGMSNH